MNVRSIPFSPKSDKSISEHWKKSVKSDVDLCKEFVSYDRSSAILSSPLLSAFRAF